MVEATRPPALIENRRPHRISQQPTAHSLPVQLLVTVYSPHAVKVIGAYLAPYQVMIGINYQGLSGLPFDRTFRATLAQGSTTVRAEERGVYRADFLNLLSLKVDKTFELHRHARVSAFFELHNLTNTNAAQGSIGTLTQAFTSQAAFDTAKSTTSYFGRVQEIVAPRIAKFGVKYVF